MFQLSLNLCQWILWINVVGSEILGFLSFVRTQIFTFVRTPCVIACARTGRCVGKIRSFDNKSYKRRSEINTAKWNGLKMKSCPRVLLCWGVYVQLFADTCMHVIICRHTIPALVSRVICLLQTHDDPSCPILVLQCSHIVPQSFHLKDTLWLLYFYVRFFPAIPCHWRAA